MAEKYIDTRIRTEDGNIFGAGPAPVPYEDLIPDSHVNLFRFAGLDLDGVISHIETSVDGLSGNDTEDTARSVLEPVRDEIRLIHPFMREGAHAEICLVCSAASYLLRTIEAGEEYPRMMNVVSASFPEAPFTVPDGPSEAFFEFIDNFSVYGLKLLQKDVRRLLSTVFDDTSESARMIPYAQREALYAVLSEEENNPAPHGFPDSGSFTVRAPETADSGPHAGGFGMDADGIFPDKGAVEKHKDLISRLPDGRDGFHIVFRAGSLYELFSLETTGMLLKNERIGRCGECGRYYVRREGEPPYCVITDAQTGDASKTCRAVHLKKAVHDLYLKAYKTHNQRYNRGTCSIEDMEMWKKEAKEAGKKAVVSELSMAEYMRILKQ